MGPVDVRRDGEPLGAAVRPQQMLVLAALLVDAGRPVPVDELIIRVWGDDPPAQARRTLQTHVARIRRLLASTAAVAAVPLVRHDGAYRLDAEPGTVDLHRFEALTSEARDPRRTADEKAGLLEQALRLWRGEPLAGLAGDWAARTRERLVLRRAEATVAWADAEIRRGRPAAVVDPATRLVEEFPLLEPAAAVLIRALAAAGRTGEALDRYELLRRRLAEELGADPGPELARLHRSLLRRGAAEAEPAPSEAVPAQLPGAVRDFTGRDHELAALDEVLQHFGGELIGMTLTVLSGMPGVGKTELAVHWAHRARAQFPDGQLFIALRGFHPLAPPVDPREALGGLLMTLGVPAAGLPDGLAERASLYRGLLADRRMLVVLDDAASVDQVRPLLPGSAGCLVLVTSRHALAGLVAAEGAHAVPVGPLPADDAIGLLSTRVGADQVAAEPAAVRDITVLCGGLPLALAVAGAHAAIRPGLTLRQLVAEMSGGRTALTALASDDPAVDVRTVFACSYHALSTAAARLFRLFSVHPGIDLGLAAAASLAGTPAADTARALADLAQAHLVSEHRPGRWTMHDLLRAYATELAARDDFTPDREAGLTRLLDHYLDAAYTADRLMNPHRAPIVPEPPAADITREPITDDRSAVAWFDTEWPTVPLLVSRASAAARHRHAWQLSWTLADYVHRRHLWHEWAAVQRLAAASADALGDPEAQAEAHWLLGVVVWRTGQSDEARAALERAAALRAELGDEHGQARVHRTLTSVAYNVGDYDEAVVQSRACVELFTRVGDRVGRANGLNAVAWSLAALGRFEEALPLCVEAVGIQRDENDRFGLANTYDTLGRVHSGLGDHDEAATWYLRALELYRELDDITGETDTLIDLGIAYRAAGRERDARTVWRRALARLQTANPAGTARVRALLGEAAESHPDAAAALAARAGA
ncbi:AfsR/SARP family transcriptional regulator [Actinoplanes aureus]|uniref:Tetratricopeptide repeat protein n=1 Tax=Actinoplanes aureus TaxID=2792083 RepID=A0A931CFB0_9ACTN|nr:BTAD domain-containing putative transcriptional regulator [Actinoplanes aureus]MBG0563860.1 tetratricopeptide repeat protein [Actinoplanes aureus]